MIGPGHAVTAPAAPALGRVRARRPMDEGSESDSRPDQPMLVLSVMLTDPTWRVRPPDGGSVVFVLVGMRVCWLHHHEVVEC